MTQGRNAAAASVASDEGKETDLTIIREQTREGLELLRALVGLLVNKPEREGPTLEDLIAALVAQQRDTLILLRQIANDQSAMLDRLPVLPVSDGGPAANGHAPYERSHRS